MFFNREPVPLLDPDKQFTEGGMPIGLTALDYWRFQFSNVWDAQEEVAEFIVEKRLEWICHLTRTDGLLVISCIMGRGSKS